MEIKVDIIKKFMAKYGISEYKLCFLCNLSRQSVRNILRNDKHAKLQALTQIANLMEIDVQELIKDNN